MNGQTPDRMVFPRLLIFGLVVIAVLAGLSLVLILITGSAANQTAAAEVNALANSSDKCVQCHKQASPGIIAQYRASSMAEAKVSCQNCHEVAAN